ncbi:Acetyltransferase YpeA [Polystyrenella longa]|uniref:Acetyltransferase YpeA n=1 Tax=Polystyrenella longa TaxID=2528007 RepID=A0A518CP70_9PLAN|nr:GNAT family N-acetyltransferase [Polystyrenella longa]QDU81022.1 Acetyltransferase YpeA [Polystyrenella longa]
MVEYRTFKNTDPPQMVALWHECHLGRGAAAGFSTDALERLVFAQSYFDRKGLIFAVEDGCLVGALHAGFGPNADRTGLDYSRGLICHLMVSPRKRGTGIGTELLRRGEEYLYGKGAKTIQAGPAPDDAPFYVGLYGGTAPVGFLHSDPVAADFFSTHGYHAGPKYLIYQRDLKNAREPINFRVTTIRRKMALSLSEPLGIPSWWWITRMGRLDTLRFGLVPKVGGPEVANVTIVGLDLYISTWHQRAIGLIDLQLAPGQTDPLYKQVLISMVCQRLREELITNVEIHSNETNTALTQMVLGTGFSLVDTGIVYDKDLNDV